MAITAACGTSLDNERSEADLVDFGGLDEADAECVVRELDRSLSTAKLIGDQRLTQEDVELITQSVEVCIGQ